MRTYEKTHPWIKFFVDLRLAPPDLWVMLGECQSKCEHISGVPLPPEIADHIHKIYLAKGVLATTAIEGNTLSEEQVALQLDDKLELPPSREYLKQETQNIIDECNRIVDDIMNVKQSDLSTARIKKTNRAVLEKLNVDEDVVPGKIRKHSVGVAGYRGAPFEDCEHLLDQMCEWLNSETFSPPPGMSIVYAIIKSILAHLYMAWIHPFGDGNGRTARLIEFQIMIASGVPSAAAHLLSNHYNQTRSEYYNQLDRAGRSGGDVLPFIRYATQGFRDGLVSQLDVIRRMQLTVMWKNYVYEIFEKKTNAVNRRRRDLVLELSAQTESVPLDELPGISRRAAQVYASKSAKTLTRDVKELIKMGLVRRDKAGLMVCKERILAFLPFKAEEGDSCKPAGGGP